MSSVNPVSVLGNSASQPTSSVLAVARQLAGINRVRRASFKSYPGMDHLAVKILLHILLEQGTREWASVDGIPEAVHVRATTVQRYLGFLGEIGLVENEKAVLGQVVRARLTGDASEVMSQYLNAIAALLAQRYEDHL